MKILKIKQGYFNEFNRSDKKKGIYFYHKSIPKYIKFNCEIIYFYDIKRRLNTVIQPLSYDIYSSLKISFPD
jgi:hypothetical protein